MDKIAYNLLSNAFKNTPNGGKIIMKLVFKPADDSFILKIEDNGTGIPKDKRDRLFVRFQQINYTDTGTGVGLHLTSELATLHKGNAAYSDSDLGGACFSVTVPLSEKKYDKEDIILDTLPESPSNAVSEEPDATGAAPVKVDAALSAPVEKSFKDYHLVIIEDNDEIRDFINSQLSDYFTVTTAINGADGLEKTLHEHPNLVICDVMMPEMNGFEVTRRIKQNFETSHIPVIILTAHSSEEHLLEGIGAGADAYITKPFSMKYLVTRIIKLIEQREKLQQKFAAEPGMVKPIISFDYKDKVFLEKMHNVIEQNIDSTDLSENDIAHELGLGRTIFYQKTKGLTGYSPNEYIRIIRMKKAADMLSDPAFNVSEVSYKVGIGDAFYFSKCFKAQFGKTPTQWQKETRSCKV
jgi:DNA-binding response OmpR family regulator